VTALLEYSDCSIRINDCSIRVYQCFQRNCANPGLIILVPHLESDIITKMLTLVTINYSSISWISIVTCTLSNRVPKLKLVQPLLLVFNRGSCLGCLNGSYTPDSPYYFCYSVRRLFMIYQTK